MVAKTVPSATFFDTVIELYSGCPADDNSTCIDFNDDTEQGFWSTLEWDSEANKDYWLFIRGYDGEYGFFTLHVFDTAPPVNSKCADAIPLIPGQEVFGYTTYATENNATCNTTTLRKGIWYKLHANKTGTMTLSTCDVATAFETDIEIYETCTESGADVCVPHVHDRKCPPGQSLTFTVEEEEKDYYIFVAGIRTDVEVSGLFRMQCVFRPAPEPQSNSSSTSSPSSTSRTSSTVSDLSSSSSSSDPYVDHALEIVEVFLVIFGFAWLVTIIFTIVCCYYKRNHKYTQMESATVVDDAGQASSAYVAPSPEPSSESQVSLKEI